MEQKNDFFSTEISLKKRAHLQASGILDIISSDESSICLNTSDGALIIEGASLRIISINISNGDIIVEGKIDSLIYNEKNQEQKSGFFARMFK